MATILGNLTPEDEYPHELGPEPNFNESMYFNFFDPKQGVGGFVRLGNRANEGRAEVTVCLFPGGGRALFGFERAEISNNDAFAAGGLHFEVVEPTELLVTRYRGSLLDLADPTVMADPRRAYTESPRQTVELDLTHRAAGPLYGGRHDRDEEERDAEQQFAKAHYEQHMQVSGTIDIAGARLAIDGFGLRDHSWGPRHWQAIESYEWLTMNFGRDLGAMVSIVRRDANRVRTGGVLIRGDRLVPIADAEIRADYAENGLYHRRVVAKVTPKGEDPIEIVGEVKGFIPLRNRRDGRVTHIGEGMTEWRLGDRTGYGLSEFLRQVA